MKAAAPMHRHLTALLLASILSAQAPLIPNGKGH